MAGETDRLFQHLAGAHSAPATRGVHASCRFEIEEGGSWNIRLDDGTVHVAKGPGEQAPACTFRAADDDLARILRGEQNLLTAALQGIVEVIGDLAVASRVQRLISAAIQMEEERRPAP